MFRRPASACVLLVALSACAGSNRASDVVRPDVLLVTIDTLRADRIGVGITPALDRLAASGIRFTTARTTVPLTLPSHVSIHTGLLPPADGVRENGTVLDRSHQTLATILKANGYTTAAFVGAFVLDRRFGLAEGFDVYDDQIARDPNASERLEAERKASVVVDRALSWLSARTKDQGLQGPFFLWLHLYDPHAPYDPPPEFRARTSSAYDGEVAYADAQLGRVIDALGASGQLARTLVIVLGDHGEGLGDHGERTHGMLLYDSTLRVPLVVVAPGQSAATVDAAVSLADVAPTILHAAGVRAPEAMKGGDLRDAGVGVRSSKPESRRSLDLYSETEYPRVVGWSPLRALADNRWKAIRSASATELYDLQQDPREQHDVAKDQASVATAMASRADAVHAASAGGSATVSPDAQERLRALGYVASSAAPRAGATLPNPANRIDTWNDFDDALSALTDRRTEGKRLLQRLASANPDAPVIQATYGRALKDAGELDAALRVYRDAAHRWPTDATLLHDLSVAAREAANAAPEDRAKALRAEAGRADQAALVLEPTSAIAHNGMGLLAIDENRPADAARSFEQATSRDPNNAAYWTNLGNARRALGNRAAAEDAYRRALTLDAHAADAANGIGVLLVEANNPADAIAYFERAVAAAPHLVEARLNLGIALQQSGQTARAREAYRQVLAAAGSSHPREKRAAAKLLTALGSGR